MFAGSRLLHYSLHYSLLDAFPLTSTESRKHFQLNTQLQYKQFKSLLFSFLVHRCLIYLTKNTFKFGNIIKIENNFFF